jgi:phage protein U
MLLGLGSVVFRILPIGLDEIDHAATASFAAHPVLGDMPSLEFTGKGPETWRIRGTLMPEFSAGTGAGDGQDDLNALHAMRESGQAQYLMRGDGVPLHWVVITRVAERSRRLNAKGVGRIIEVEIDVVRALKPDPATYLMGLDLGVG